MWHIPTNMNQTQAELETEITGRKQELAAIRNQMAKAFLAGQSDEATQLGNKWHTRNIELIQALNRLAIMQAENFRKSHK